MNKWINLFLIVYVAFVTGVYNYWRSFRVLFIWGSWCQYFSLFTFIMTVLVFIFVINRNYDKMPSFVGKAFEKVSGLCMNAYLVSWIFDQIFYPMLKERITDIEQRFPFYFAVVPIVFILSLLLSYVLKVLQTLLTDAVLKLIGLFRKKKQKDDTPTVPVVSAQ